MKFETDDGELGIKTGEQEIASLIVIRGLLTKKV